MSANRNPNNISSLLKTYPLALEHSEALMQALKTAQSIAHLVDHQQKILEIARQQSKLFEISKFSSISAELQKIDAVIQNFSRIKWDYAIPKGSVVTVPVATMNPIIKDLFSINVEKLTPQDKDAQEQTKTTIFTLNNLLAIIGILLTILCYDPNNATTTDIEKLKQVQDQILTQMQKLEQLNSALSEQVRNVQNQSEKPEPNQNREPKDHPRDDIKQPEKPKLI